jgi:hypothetical protein
MFGIYGTRNIGIGQTCDWFIRFIASFSTSHSEFTLITQKPRWNFFVSFVCLPWEDVRLLSVPRFVRKIINALFSPFTDTNRIHPNPKWVQNILAVLSRTAMGAIHVQVTDIAYCIAICVRSTTTLRPIDYIMIVCSVASPGMRDTGYIPMAIQYSKLPLNKAAIIAQ